MAPELLTRFKYNTIEKLFKIYDDGTMVAIDLTIDEIENGHPRSIVTKEYVQQKGGGCTIINSDPVPYDHGGLKAGTIIAGKKACEVLETILFPESYPSFTSFSSALL